MITRSSTDVLPSAWDGMGFLEGVGRTGLQRGADSFVSSKGNRQQQRKAHHIDDGSSGEENTRSYWEIEIYRPAVLL